MLNNVNINCHGAQQVVLFSDSGAFVSSMGYQHVDITVFLNYSGMRLGFGKNYGKFYVAIDSNPNTVGSSYT